MAFASLSQLVQRYESSGNPTATTSGSTASGLYGFTNPTWAQYANQIGVSTTQYPTAASAPSAVQDQVFQQAVSQRGLGDWTCPGCDPALTSYIASNPSQASLPIFASGTGSTDMGTSGGFGFDPSTGSDTVPVAPGQTGAESATATPSTGGLLTPVWELLTRGGVFILGMMLLFIALIAMLWQSKTVQVSVKSLAAAA